MNTAEISIKKPDSYVAAIKTTSIKDTESATIEKKPQVKGNQASAITSKDEIEPKEKIKELEHIIQAINEFIKKTARHLSFSIHEGTGNIIVQVINNETGDVIREVPQAKLLDIAAKLQEMVGILFDEET